MDLDVIERYYDLVPRATARTEEVGPFTLFVAEEGTGWQFYARPRLGLTEPVTAADVRRLLQRQAELGVPRSLEWVDDVTPSLLPAVGEVIGDAAGNAELVSCPLLVLPAGVEPRPPPDRADAAPVRCEVMTPEHDDLPLVVGAAHAAFDGGQEATPATLGAHRLQIAQGTLIVVGAYDADGRVVGGGTAAPRRTTAELMGIGVLGRARRNGVGAAITRALVGAARSAGVETLLLTAGSDEAASIYRAVGFERVGTACILQVGDD